MDAESANPAPEKRSPIVQTFPNGETCMIALDEETQRDNARVDRVALMLAAALPGVRVTRVSSDAGQLLVRRDGYYNDLSNLSATLLNEMLRTRLAPDPVLSLARHPAKPYIWLLVLSFRVQWDHLDALRRRVPGIMEATQSPDASYGGYQVELFVPGLGLDKPASTEGEAAEDGGDLLLRAIRHVLSFQL